MSASSPVGASPTATVARPDLDSRAQIHDMVVAFYREVVFDDVLEHVFGEVAQVDWALHIPKLIDYWCRVLLGQPGYEGSMLGAHREVHEIEALELAHFDRWYALFLAAVDGRWEGPKAEEAKRHAARIGATLARRLLDEVWAPDLAGERAGDTSPRGSPARPEAPRHR